MSKRESLQLKGIAILLMLWHHLFGQNKAINLIVPGTETVIGGAIYEIGRYGQICVACFLFLSGVGLFHSENSFRKNLYRVSRLYLKMILVMVLLYIPISIAKGTYRFNFFDFLLNLTAIRSSYCGEWWFVLLYAELMIVFMILGDKIKKWRKCTDAVFVVFDVVLILCMKNHVFPAMSNSKLYSFVRGQVYQFAVYFINVLCGFYFSKYGILDAIFKRFITKTGSVFIDYFLPCILLTVSFWIYTVFCSKISILFSDYLIAPMFLIGCWKLISNVKGSILMLLGENSTFLWLVHPVLLNELTSIVYFPKVFVLVFLWLLGLCLPPALLLRKIAIPIEKLNKKYLFE